MKVDIKKKAAISNKHQESNAKLQNAYVIYKHAGEWLQKLETTVVPQMWLFEEH